jgi:hypothetical protein
MKIKAVKFIVCSALAILTGGAFFSPAYSQSRLDMSGQSVKTSKQLTFVKNGQGPARSSEGPSDKDVPEKVKRFCKKYKNNGEVILFGIDRTAPLDKIDVENIKKAAKETIEKMKIGQNIRVFTITNSYVTMVPIFEACYPGENRDIIDALAKTQKSRKERDAETYDYDDFMTYFNKQIDAEVKFKRPEEDKTALIQILNRVTRLSNGEKLIKLILVSDMLDRDPDVIENVDPRERSEEFRGKDRPTLTDRAILPVKQNEGKAAFDKRKADFEGISNRDIDEIMASLKKNKAFAKLGKDTEVVIYGVGRSDLGGRRDLSFKERAGLERFWQMYFANSGTRVPTLFNR